MIKYESKLYFTVMEENINVLGLWFGFNVYYITSI